MKKKAKVDFAVDLGADKSFLYKITRAIFIMLLVISVAKNVDLWLKYNRLQEAYIDTMIHYTDLEKEQIIDAMKKSLEHVKIDPKKESGIDLFPYKERSLNKEFENLNKEIEKDIENKIDKVLDE